MVGASEPPRVLIVTLDARAGTRLARALAAAGYDTRWEWSSLAGLAAVAEWTPALVVLDWEQPFIDGATFTAALRVGLTSPPPVVVLVADDTVGVAQLGVAAVLPRPVSPAQVVATVRQVLAPPC